MNAITDLAPLLGGYPGWVRILVFLYFVGGVTGYGALVLFAPTAQFTLDAVRLVGRVTTGKPLVFDVIARNPTSAKVDVKELILSFHNGKPPSGGLQGFESVSATYQISALENGKVLKVRSGSEVLGETSVVYPYAGQNFAQVRVPVAQAIDKDGTDRFRVELSAPDIPKLDQRFFDVVAVYNEDKETKVKRVELP